MLTLLAPFGALAGDLAADGSFVFDPQATFTYDFEDEMTPGDTPVATQEDAKALSGGRDVKLGAFSSVDVPVTFPPGLATYRISGWIHDTDLVGEAVLVYNDAHRPDEVIALYPTGRVTSDGWIELANDHIRVDGDRLVGAVVGFFAPKPGLVDAIEIVKDGDESLFPSEANAACDGISQQHVCGTGQVCLWNECRNVSGWVPPIPPDRDDVATYLETRLRFLFGPFEEREKDLPISMATIAEMRTAQDRWTYWNAFMTAVRQLHDGHTSTSGLADFIYENPRPITVCFVEGDADLSHGVEPADSKYRDILVSHAGADHNLGLKAGDRLVRIDGEHPIAWAQKLIGVNWGYPSISNHVTFAEVAGNLKGMISRWASEIEVQRCDQGTMQCGAVEVISIKDLPFDPPGTTVSGVACDNRPIRHLPDAPANHGTGDTVYAGIPNETDPSERIYGLEWESLYTTTGSDGVGAALTDAVASWQTNDARGVLLDHRTGYGGTILAPEIIWEYMVEKHATDFYIDRSFSDEPRPTLAQGKAIFDAAVADGDVQYAGSVNPVTDVPVALLITQDVSASDWLPLGLKNAPGGKIRIFGPYQTNGGFSTRYSFGYWLGMSFVLAVGDDVQPDGSTHNGFGVEPDEVVLPKQSDLMVGKDTVFEAALAWIRQEAKP